jgi:signal transduction histidine kinase
MLVSPAPDLAAEQLEWVADALSRCFARLEPPQGALPDDEPRMRREHGLLFNIINAATDPILFTNIDGQLIIANTRAEMLFTAPDDVSEGRRRAVQLNNMFFSAALSRTTLGEGEAGRRELLLVDPTEGTDLLFELLSTVVSDPREGTGVVSILRNITDLRLATRQIDENYARLRAAEAEVRAERDRLNLLIDSVADPIIVTDQEGEISLMNNPAERLFTIVPASGEEAQRIVRANDAHFTSFVSGLLSTGWETTRRGEIALVDPHTSKLVPVEALAAKMLSEVGELTAIVTILHDRTEAIERNHLYEQLKLASEELEAKVRAATGELANQNELLRRQALELEQASAAKSQFLANVSHELRTPLNAILGYAAMTLQGVSGELSAPQRRNLSRIDANARHLLTLINEILDITRIEAGRMPIQVVAFNLPDLVREVTTELEPIIAKSELAVVSKVPADLPMRTDRQKVKQILVNLLSNALKFTQKGSVTIKSQMVSRQTIAISVTDTGIGIPKVDQTRIFEDFRQVDSSPRRAYGGTGLGLSICRRLTQMLRGSLKVESRLGHGSTFTLTLPVSLKK